MKVLRETVIKPNRWKVGLGGFGVTCSSRDPRFAGLHPVEVDGFFQDTNSEHKSSGWYFMLKSSGRYFMLKSSGRYFMLGVPNLRFQAP